MRVSFNLLLAAELWTMHMVLLRTDQQWPFASLFGISSKGIPCRTV